MATHSSILACCCSVTQSCLTLCNSMDRSPPGSSVHGILQAGKLESVAMPSSRDLPKLGIEPGFPAFQVDSLSSEPPGKYPTKYKINSKDLLYTTENYIQYLVTNQNGKKQENIQTYIYVCVYITNYFAVYLKQIQYCKSTILQLRIN